MRHVLLATLLASVSQATAQTPCTPGVPSSLPPGDVAWCAADKAPSIVTQATIRYPEILLNANVAGVVVLEATVDTAGRIDMRTLNVRSETHALFTAAVRASIPLWRFAPARVAGQPLRARGMMRVEFLLPNHDSIPREVVTEPARETSTGLEIATGWRTPAYDPPATVDATRL